MQTLSLTQPAPSTGTGRLSWRVVAGALRGNALAAFPDEAFSQDVVVQRIFGREHILLLRPEAIRHILIENPPEHRPRRGYCGRCSGAGCSSARAKIGGNSGG